MNTIISACLLLSTCLAYAMALPASEPKLLSRLRPGEAQVQTFSQDDGLEAQESHYRGGYGGYGGHRGYGGYGHRGYGGGWGGYGGGWGGYGRGYGGSWGGGYNRGYGSGIYYG